MCFVVEYTISIENIYFKAIEFVRSGRMVLQQVYAFNASGIVLSELDLCLTKSIEFGFRICHGKHWDLFDKCFFLLSFSCVQTL